MVNKKIMIKNSAQPFTLTTVVVTVLIVIALFQGTYFFIADNINASGGTVDSKYISSYQKLNTSSTSLSSNVEEIKSNLQSIGEADNTFQVAWNGLKGLGNTLKLPISFLDTSLETFSAFTGLGVIPSWAKILIEIGLIAALVFLILAILKGEPRT